jgi:hypothetical protein
MILAENETLRSLGAALSTASQAQQKAGTSPMGRATGERPMMSARSLVLRCHPMALVHDETMQRKL